MITEVVTFIVGISFIVLALFIGYRAGKDVAQREASYTIAQLRRAVFLSRKEVDDLRGRVNRLMKQFRDAQKLFKTLKKSGMRGMPRMFG